MKSLNNKLMKTTSMTSRPVAASLCRGASGAETATQRRGYTESQSHRGIGRWPMIRRGTGILPVISCLIATLAFSQDTKAKENVVGQAHRLPPSGSNLPNPDKPRIEVCFVLDTTGSMGGLIEGAKQKIWSIANEMVSAKPTPELKLGLIGYRDRGDEYVTRTFNLTDDIDAIYAHLREFKADGGGDTPESVNEALDEAIHNMTWSSDKKVLKIVFLVGDAPPHMDYPNSPKYPDLCREAAKKDLIINTVQCGDMADTRPIWQEIAKLSEGSYAAIAQSGNMSVVSTPMDKELAKLNEEIGATVIPYGDSKLQSEVHAKQAMAAAAPVSAI